MLHLGIITLFPEIFDSLRVGITGRAWKNGLIEMTCWNPRDFTENEDQRVDDKPYGGGPGMVMRVEPLMQAIQAAQCRFGNKDRLIYLSPQGACLTQEKITELSTCDHLIFVAGRYEGWDERLMALCPGEEISIGDYVLTGGELPTCVIIDALVRQLPGALGDAESAKQDSFATGLLDHPHYTRPPKVCGEQVPNVLCGGNHAEIKRWRLKQALGRTYLRRPELLKKRSLTQEEEILLNEFLNGEKNDNDYSTT